MLMQSKKNLIKLLLLFGVVFILACGLSIAPNASGQPAFDPTKAALELQATSMSLQLTQASLNSQPSVQTALPPIAQPTAQPADTQVQPTPTQDVEARIQSANVLVYENTDELGIGMWVQDALDGLNIKYTQTGSYSGRFMEQLNSGTIYDLIIVDAEDQRSVSGEFWDVINTRLVRDKAALIIEIWYLNREANGPISKILSGCGIKYQKDYDLAEPIYWWEPTHPIFNEPNTVLPLLHVTRYWNSQAGDRIRLGSGGDATLLAGLDSSKSTDGAVLAVCYDGRVIVQTFMDHDYKSEDIIPLWQNYIHYTLKNHFLAVP